MKRKGCIWLNILSLLTVGIFLWLTLPTCSLAASTTMGNFSAVIEVPENQIGNNNDYFNILQAAGTSDELYITITNDSTTESNLSLSFNRAITNIVGVVEYSGSNDDLSQPDLNIEDFVSLEETQLHLAAGETVRVPLKVTMPSETFKGILAGGIYIAAEETAGENTNVKQRFSREIAVLLQENQTVVTPDLAFEGAEAAQENGRNGINLIMNNQAAAYLNQVNLTYSVSQDDATLLEGSNENLQFTPSSRFNFFLPLGEQNLAAGDYQITVSATSGQQQWQDTVAFSVSQETADELNATSVTPTETSDKANNTLLYLVIGIIGIILLIGIGLLTYKYFKLKKQIKK